MRDSAPRIKEHQIVDHSIFPPTAGKLKDEVMTIKPVQKQVGRPAHAFSKNRPHVSLSRTAATSTDISASARGEDRCRNQKQLPRRRGKSSFRPQSATEVATAIRGALIMAKMHLVPIRRGYWGSATVAEKNFHRTPSVLRERRRGETPSRHSPVFYTV